MNPQLVEVDRLTDPAVFVSWLQLVLVSAVQHPGAQNLTYLHSKGTEARVKPVTHWVVADLSNPK